MAVTTNEVTDLRHDWTIDELRAIHNQPLNELLFEAQRIHRIHHDPTRIQTSQRSPPSNAAKPHSTTP